MDDVVLKKSIEIEKVEIGHGSWMINPASREVFGVASETQGSSAAHGWVVNRLTAKVFGDGEGVTVFDSSDAMRFGPRHYSDEQFDHIRAATANRVEPVAPRIPLDS